METEVFLESKFNAIKEHRNYIKRYKGTLQDYLAILKSIDNQFELNEIETYINNIDELFEDTLSLLAKNIENNTTNPKNYLLKSILKSTNEIQRIIEEISNKLSIFDDIKKEEDIIKSNDLYFPLPSEISKEEYERILKECTEVKELLERENKSLETLNQYLLSELRFQNAIIEENTDYDEKSDISTLISKFYYELQPLLQDEAINSFEKNSADRFCQLLCLLRSPLSEKVNIDQICYDILEELQHSTAIKSIRGSLFFDSKMISDPRLED